MAVIRQVRHFRDVLDKCRRRATHDVADTRTAGRDQETPACQPRSARRGFPRHGTGLDVDQMGTSRGNARNFRNSVEAMLTGTLPTTKSAALPTPTAIATCLAVISRPNCSVIQQTFLRQLNAINPEVRINEALHIRALPGTTARRRADNSGPCPQAIWPRRCCAMQPHSFRRRVDSVACVARNISAGRPSGADRWYSQWRRGAAPSRVGRCRAAARCPAIASCASRSSRSVNSSPSSRSGSGLSA